MVEAGINSIRVYHLPVEDSKEVALIKKVLRKAHERYGLRVLVGDWIGLYEHPNDDLLNRSRIIKVVRLYADESWVLAWEIGNEHNYYLKGGPLAAC